jgi:hypothetical protein
MARTRGIVVRTFDASSVGDNGTAGPPMFAPYAYAVAADGRHYVICSEGVGWEVTDDRPLTVQTYAGTTYELSLFDVQWRAAADDASDVDLADHIRTFGSRLDANHYGWVARLSGK